MPALGPDGAQSDHPGGGSTTTDATGRPNPLLDLGLFGLLSVIICLIGWGAYVALTSHVRQQEVATLSSVAKLKGAQIESWLGERLGDARVLAGHPAVVATLSPAPPDNRDQIRQHAHQALATTQEAHGHIAIELFDAQGVRVDRARTPLRQLPPERPGPDGRAVDGQGPRSGRLLSHWRPGLPGRVSPLPRRSAMVEHRTRRHWDTSCCTSTWRAACIRWSRIGPCQAEQPNRCSCAGTATTRCS